MSSGSCYSEWWRGKINNNNNNKCYINFLSLHGIDKCETDKCKHRIQQDGLKPRRYYASFYLVKQEQNTKVESREHTELSDVVIATCKIFLSLCVVLGIHMAAHS